MSLQQMTFSDRIGYNTNMINPSIASRIDPYKTYTARQIAELGFIQNIAGNANDHKFILRLIKRGQLPATNLNEKGKRKVWQVSGQTILNFLQNL